jgi:cytoskeleton protein RodZ
MSSLGEAFRTAREARGLTLSDAAEHTHIRSVYLAAIESEDWPAIGAPVYVRGFIRTYARFLGLDSEEAVARFAERVPSESPSQVVESMSPMGSGSANRGGLSFGAIAGIVVALLLVGFVGYEYYAYKTGPDGQPAAVATAGAPIAAAPSPASATAAAPTAAGSSAPAIAPTDAVSPGLAGADSPVPEGSAAAEEPSPGPVAKDQLQIRLAERSWIRVVIDGTTALEGIFPAGTIRTFSGKTAVVRAGNAAGVDVTVAGRSLGAMGGPGDVVEHAYRLSPPE